MTRDWQTWHEDYDDESSALTQRLRAAQVPIRRWLAEADRPRRVVSACAGQGRDLLEVLGPDDAVTALLVELDPVLSQQARDLAASRGLSIEVRTADAGLSASYDGFLPADLVLLTGVFGTVTGEDVERTVRATAAMTAAGGTVVWTRHRREPDLTPRICGWFAEAGLEEVSFDSPGPGAWSVGTHRQTGGPSGDLPERLFAFV